MAGGLDAKWECAMSRIFLTAEWRDLLMLNYAIDPAVLRPWVPDGTELDAFEGTTYVSVVGFRFLQTRVFGIPVPGHRDFEEVNLRFYVRRRGPEGWRRGVSFIRELVPRPLIALVARRFYGEPYLALPMRHRIEAAGAGLRAEYAWWRAGRWEAVRAIGEGEPVEAASDSQEEFITEHYWGYTKRAAPGCNEYQVEHPRWRLRRATEAALDADVATLYGGCFVESLAAPPASAFIANGSPVAVRTKCEVPGKKVSGL